MVTPENPDRSAGIDRWLMLLVILLVVTVALFVLDYFPYPFGIILLSAAILARLSSIYWHKKP